MYTLELELAIGSSDSNKILGRDWRAKHAIFKKIKDEIYLKTRNKTPEKPLEKFKISVTRYSTKALDWDNLIASLKPTIDGLRYAGIIIDDSWQYLRHVETNQTIAPVRRMIVKVVEND